MSSTTATTNTMPTGATISLTTSQLMKMLAEAKAEGRAEVLQQLGMPSSTGVASSAAQPAAPAPIPCKPSKGKRKRITLPDGAVVKNPTSAYIFFCKKHRTETKEANPELKSTELTAALGAKWSALMDEGKTPYNALAAADKERYVAQVAQAAEAASGASTGATEAPAPAPAAAPPAAPSVLPGGEAALTLDIQPVPPPSPPMTSSAAPTVFKTGAPNASSSA